MTTADRATEAALPLRACNRQARTPNHTVAPTATTNRASPMSPTRSARSSTTLCAASLHHCHSGPAPRPVPTPDPIHGCCEISCDRLVGERQPGIGALGIADTAERIIDRRRQHAGRPGDDEPEQHDRHHAREPEHHLRSTDGGLADATWVRARRGRARRRQPPD